MRRTGFPPKVYELILVRAAGWCERCGRPGYPGEVHHRRPRGMGGTRRPETNYASCGVQLCLACHRAVESRRIDAFAEGFLVTQNADPAAVPVLRRGEWVYLDDEGGMTTTREGGSEA